MRTIISLLLGTLLLLATPPSVFAQSRSSGKPGEVTTRPDFGERWPDRIAVGEAAPEFTLPLLTAAEPTAKKDKKTAKTDEAKVSLKDLHGKKPVVLIFGSITCPPFRGQLTGVDKVFSDFKDRAEFLFVYIREAHPDSVISVLDEKKSEVLEKIPQADSDARRTQSAAICQRTFDLQLPVAVDEIDNSVGKAYSGWPNRMVVVGTNGKVMFATAGSPGGTNARTLRTWLEGNLK